MGKHVASWTGSDISAEMINIAKAKDATENTHFVVADSDSAFENAPFDIVCAFHVLHLVPDPQQTIKNIFSQIKPGGFFISKTVCPGEMGFIPRLIVPVLNLFGVAPPILHFLTKKKIEAMVLSAGFEVLEQKTFGKNNAVPYILARRP